jgi:hypothetical protein
MTVPKHTPTPLTMRLFVRFGGQTVALMLGDPDDIDQPRKRIIVLPRDPAAREDDPNVRLLRDLVRRQDAHDDLVKACQLARPDLPASATDPRRAIDAALAKAGAA